MRRFMQLGKWDAKQWRKIGVLLQVPPSGGPVKLQAVVEGEIEGDNFPLTDPCLPFEEIDDPNGLIFTAGDYATPKKIKIWGNDDAVLQVEGASAEDDEYYQAVLVVTVIDSGGDKRYEGDGEMVEGVCVDCLEREVEFDIEDNECGAFGLLAMDVSNPYYITDPNYADDDPDCHVDIYDIIAMATRWVNCSDPKDPNCTKYNE